MRRSRSLLGILLFFVGFHCHAQELMVKSVMLQPSDNTAKEKPVVVNDEDTCALVKIKVGDLKGLQFTNHSQYVGDVAYEDGVYYLYKSTNLSRMISYSHPDYAPGVIDMADYGYRRLKPGKTYLVTLEVPSKGLGKNFVIFKVFPVSARLTFNNKQLPVSTTGVYEFPVTDGAYNYFVEAPDYEPIQGSVTLAKGENKTISPRLKPIIHEVNVSCNISNAHVFIDNFDYGKVGLLRLPQGKHNVRVQYEGYLDSEKTIEINSTTQHLSFNLKKNENRIDIHATPVTIISNSKKLYKNNKELEGWSSGKPIMFMPGKYMISDDEDNSKVITVGTKPMKVVL